MFAIADGYQRIADTIVMLLGVGPLTILIVSAIAAEVGAKQGTAMRSRRLPIFCGWLIGFAVAMITGAMITGWVLLYYDVNSVRGLMLGLIVGMVIGGVSAFKAARRMAS